MVAGAASVLDSQPGAEMQWLGTPAAAGRSLTELPPQWNEWLRGSDVSCIMRLVLNAVLR